MSRSLPGSRDGTGFPPDGSGKVFWGDFFIFGHQVRGDSLPHAFIWDS